MAKVLALLYEGFEEIEFTAPVDIMRRAGIEVTTAGTTGTLIRGGLGVTMQADARLLDLDTKQFSALVIPGGRGWNRAINNQTILDVIEEFNKEGKIIAAICAAPMILAKAGVLKDRRATCYPGFEKKLDYPRGDKVVVDENIITSQGPGTAIEFGLRIVEQLVGKPKADQVRKGMLA